MLLPKSHCKGETTSEVYEASYTPNLFFKVFRRTRKTRTKLMSLDTNQIFRLTVDL